MTDWAATTAAQIMARHAQIKGERTVVVDGAQLEAEIAAALRIAKRMGALDEQINQRSDLREAIAP
jgi:hypothetical protein